MLRDRLFVSLFDQNESPNKTIIVPDRQWLVHSAQSNFALSPITVIEYDNAKGKYC